MSMSKKDYQAIAHAVWSARGFAFNDQGQHERSLNRVAEVLAETLAATNARFDRARFLEACETGTCKGMPKRPRYQCAACGRPELECSKAPCPVMVEERAEGGQ